MSYDKREYQIIETDLENFQDSKSDFDKFFEDDQTTNINRLETFSADTMIDMRQYCETHGLFLLDKCIGADLLDFLLEIDYKLDVE